jgi:dihydrolipoamide dehydrogenase (EC 1.8.1.4)
LTEILEISLALGLEFKTAVKEAANAIAQRDSVHTLAFRVHTHPTLSEVLDEAFKRAAGAAGGH